MQAMVLVVYAPTIHRDPILLLTNFSELLSVESYFLWNRTDRYDHFVAPHQ